MIRTGAIFLTLSALVSAASLDQSGLSQDLQALAAKTPGRLGVCVRTRTSATCVRAEERFPLQSVMKLLVGFAVLDGVDTKGWRLDEPVTLRKEDLSLFVQPVSKLVGPQGYRTTVGDLVRRAIIDSDSAAVDNLITRIGGTAVVNDALSRHGIRGLRVDRDERHLQTEIAGITWKPSYIDADVLDREIHAVPEPIRDRAYAAYQRDPRDTATPAGMADFLLRLANGELLSKPSTGFLLQAMKECATYPGRLKAGVPASWEISHKTGTSPDWKGVTAATNDVGILRTPDGALLSISAFLADSPASSSARDASLAAISKLVVSRYH